jgi:hypothetical protein
MPSIDDSGCSSWAEEICAYNATRHSLPWASKDVQPVSRVGNMERKIAERDVDPILMGFRDPSKESRRLQARENKMEAARLRVTELAQSKRNILNHHGGENSNRFDVNELRATLNEGKNIRGNNMINYLPLDAQKTCPIVYSEAYNSKHIKHREIPRLPKKGVRDMNIITNEFFQENTRKKNKEVNDTREMVAAKFWKTHDLNPLTQKVNFNCSYALM